MNHNLIIVAAQFAARCHAGQVRKYNGRPYITHPIRVAGRVATHEKATGELVAAAFLHDVVEDCGVTLLEIESRFGTEVARYVGHLTNFHRIPGIPRHERKRADRERLREIPWECKIVKLIDRIDNLWEIDRTDGFAKIYAQESLLLVEVIRDGDYELSVELTELAQQILQ